MVLRQCTRCKRHLSGNCFSTKGRSKSKLRSRCNECWASPATQWIYRNLDKAKESQERHKKSGKCREYRLQTKYGIGNTDYSSLLEAQHGGCAICGSTNSKNRWDAMSVDHDHLTGKIRGLLCNSCNRGLGYFNDDVTLFRNAIAYLIANKSGGDAMQNKQESFTDSKMVEPVRKAIWDELRAQNATCYGEVDDKQLAQAAIAAMGSQQVQLGSELNVSEKVLSIPTDAMCDEARGFVLGLDMSGRTFGKMQKYLEMGGYPSLPFIIEMVEEAPGEHITKRDVARCIWELMARAYPIPVPIEELSEQEAVDVMHTAIELYLRDPVAESAAVQAFRALKQIADIRRKP